MITEKKHDKVLLALAIGERYEALGRSMIESFLKFNEGWDVRLYTLDDIISILPNGMKYQSPFNKCEIGRWCAMKKAIEDGYRTALYCDNDIRFYSEYMPVEDSSVVLFPHCVTDETKRARRHWIAQDGIFNIGMVEVNLTDADLESGETPQAVEVCSFIVDECVNNTKFVMHQKHGCIWTQTICSCLLDIGYDVVSNENPACNVAHWNMKDGERKIIRSEHDGRLYVVCGGETYRLCTYHFSNSGIKTLEQYGEVLSDMKAEYLAAADEITR